MKGEMHKMPSGKMMKNSAMPSLTKRKKMMTDGGYMPKRKK